MTGGKPCYGFCVDPANPDYSPICDYDDEGYYYAPLGADAPGGPIAWDRLGTMWLDWVEVYGRGAVRAGER